MTVAELISYLQTQDQEAVVQVLHAEANTGYEGGSSVYQVDLTPELVSYEDYRTFAKPESPWFNERTLLLGCNDS